MTARPLTRLMIEPGVSGVHAVWNVLPDILAQRGPAYALTPTGPSALRDWVTESVRPDDPDHPLENDETAVVVCTSGSMGRPRGVLLSAHNLVASSEATELRLGGPAGWLLAVGVEHIAGFQVLVRSLLAGTSPVILPSVGGASHFSVPQFVDYTWRTARASGGRRIRTSLVPTQLARIMDHHPSGTDALLAYDTVLIGGAATPQGLLNRARALGINAVTTYGMTETAGGCVYDGSPLSGTSVHIVEPDDREVGQIAISGATVGLGYRLLPQLSSEAFSGRTHFTADLGRVDSNQRLRILARRDDVVQVGGLGVSLAAVEANLQQHPLVAEVAVVAIADSEWGARICAFVVPQPGLLLTREALEHSLGDRIAEALGPAARPRLVIMVDELPANHAGKIDRQLLRDRAERRANRPARPGAHRSGQSIRNAKEAETLRERTERKLRASRRRPRRRPSSKPRRK